MDRCETAGQPSLRILGIKLKRAGLGDADIFIPNGRIFADISGQEVDAFGGMQVDDLNAVLAEPVDPASEVDRLAYDYSGDAELADQSAAIPARRQRGNHDLVAIGALASCAAEGIGLSMDGRVVFLDPPIATPA